MHTSNPKHSESPDLLSKEGSEYLQEVGLMLDWLATQRVLPLLTELPISEKTKGQIISVLCKEVSYVPKVTAEIHSYMLAWVQNEVAKKKKALRKQHIVSLHHPSPPPLSLKERMTRDSAQSLVDGYQTLSKLDGEISSKLREATKTLTALRKRGDTVRTARSKLVNLLMRSKFSRRKATNSIQTIIKLWNPTIALANAETARISSKREENRTALREQQK